LKQSVLSTGQSSRIAVIGTGIAGMSAAWLLNGKHDITVFERENRVGGHSNTVDAPGDPDDIPVDTGFIVYNENNYPNLTALFSHLAVPTKLSEMSFSASLDGGRLEYCGAGLNGLFGQRRNLARPRFWKMLSELYRFYRDAPDFLNDPANRHVSLAEFLECGNYHPTLIEDHLYPMGAAIWSTTAAEMGAYPAQAFIRFFENHGLLKFADRPAWKTVDGGSREYVKRLTEPFRDRIRFGGVRSIKRRASDVSVIDNAGTEQVFDHVVVATHADEALRLLEDPDPRETELLGAWRYTRNRAVLHSDASLMPRRRRVWSSWNFVAPHPLSTGQSGNDFVCVTYWMNRLQSLDGAKPLFVTLNPGREPAGSSIIREFEYTHPFFDKAALASQERLWALQGARRTWFCGSYFGHGFHEDALQSGLAVAEQLGGVRRPWSVAQENDRIHVNLTEQEIAA
jgi:predicted NAD/FAD-binding protein